MTRVVGYVRVSTDEQATEGWSLGAQASKLEGYCKAFDLELVDILEEDATGKTLDRPKLRQALAMLRVSEATGVLVAKLDRLTRKVVDMGVLLDTYFAENPKRPRYDLFSVNEKVDTTTAMGRAMLFLMVTMSQWERETIVERTRDGLAQARKNGVVLGAPPFGYRRAEDGGMVTDENEAKTLAVIHSLAAEGMTVRAIADRLNAMGLPARRAHHGSRWRKSQVHRVLLASARPRRVAA